MTRTLKTEAIVLRKRNVLGKDTLVTLLTQEKGKIIVLAKGIKKITSRRSPHIQTGNLIKIIVHKQKDRYYLQETILISYFSQIKKEKEKLNYLYFFLYVLDRFLAEDQTEPVIYKLIKKFLIDLSNNVFSSKLFTEYLNQLLQLLGFTHKNLSLEALCAEIESITNEKLPFSIMI